MAIRLRRQKDGVKIKRREKDCQWNWSSEVGPQPELGASLKTCFKQCNFTTHFSEFCGPAISVREDYATEGGGEYPRKFGICYAFISEVLVIERHTSKTILVSQGLSFDEVLNKLGFINRMVFAMTTQSQHQYLSCKQSDFIRIRRVGERVEIASHKSW